MGGGWAVVGSGDGDVDGGSVGSAVAVVDGVVEAVGCGFISGEVIEDAVGVVVVGSVRQNRKCRAAWERDPGTDCGWVAVDCCGGQGVGRVCVAVDSVAGVFRDGIADYGPVLVCGLVAVGGDRAFVGPGDRCLLYTSPSPRD